MLRKVALSTFLLGFSLYIFLPTPDELFIYPAVGLFLTYTFHISFLYAVVLVTLFYYGAGAVSMAAALLIGGKPIYFMLKEKYEKRKTQPLLTRFKSTSEQTKQSSIEKIPNFSSGQTAYSCTIRRKTNTSTQREPNP
jgi:hypothetical protein